MIRLENILKRSLQDVLKLSWRRLQNVLNKSWRCLKRVLKTKTKTKDVLKTSSSRRMFAGKHSYLKLLAKSIVDLRKCLRCQTDNIHYYIKQAGIKDRKFGKEQLITLIISGNILEGSWDACKSIEVAVD